MPLLNNLESWVRYALTEFRELKSSYAKTMFHLLKGYRTTGYAYFSKADFNELLDVPNSYLSRPGDIDRKVLQPVKEELTPLFRGFGIRKKYGKGRGKPVIGYQFAWKPETKDKEDVRVSHHEREKTKLFNIEHNADLTQTEKWRAMDKVLGLTLGSTERSYRKQQQAEHDQAIEEQAKCELLAELKRGFHSNGQND